MKPWYWLTTYWPRKLPVTERDWIDLKLILTIYYGVADNPKSWATISGHVCSTPSHTVRRSYGYLANTAKRLVINAQSHAIQSECVKELQAELEAKMKEMSDVSQLDATGVN